MPGVGPREEEVVPEDNEEVCEVFEDGNHAHADCLQGVEVGCEHGHEDEVYGEPYLDDFAV